MIVLVDCGITAQTTLVKSKYKVVWGLIDVSLGLECSFLLADGLVVSIFQRQMSLEDEVFGFILKHKAFILSYRFGMPVCLIRRVIFFKHTCFQAALDNFVCLA